jgi:glycine oxidase
METADVVVVGAGIVGGTIGYVLAKAGLDVCLMDGESVGSGSSGHGHGVLTLVGKDFRPGAHFRLGRTSTAMYPKFVEMLIEDSGLDPLYHELPGLSLALTEEEEQIFRAAYQDHKADMDLRWIDGDECRQLESRITPDAIGAVLYRYGQVDAYRMSLSAAQAIERMGGRVVLKKVTGLVKQGDRVVGVEHSGGTIAAGVVVLAMGAWVRQAQEWLEFPVPVRPLHGEVLNVRLPGPPIRAFINTARHGPVFQRRDGIVLIGSIGGVAMSGMDVDAKQVFDPNDRTVPVFDLDPHEANRLFMIERGLRIMPALEHAELVAHLAGVRPLSADRMPIIGPVPGLDGVLLAAGHGTKGIHLAPVTAHLIANLVLHRTTDLTTQLEAFLPSRFSGVTF